MPLPPLPKALRSFGAASAAEGYRRIDQWAKGAQDLLQRLREGNLDAAARLAALEAGTTGGGGGGVSDHGALTGLGDNDHPQYLLAADTVDVWMADAPPSSPHADNDECNGSSVDGAWNTFDPYSGTAALTVSADSARGCYELTRATTNPTNIWGGRYKAIPAGNEWAITGKFSFDLINTSPTGRLTGIGLALFEDPAGAPTTSNLDVLMFGPSSSSPYSVWKGVPTAYNVFPAVTSVDAPACYLRIRKGPTDSGYDFSLDGHTWHQLTNSVSSYAYWGFAAYSWSELRARVHWLRVQEAAGVSTFSTCPSVGGRLVSVGV